MELQTIGSCLKETQSKIQGGIETIEAGEAGIREDAGKDKRLDPDSFFPQSYLSPQKAPIPGTFVPTGSSVQPFRVVKRDPFLSCLLMEKQVA